MFVHQRLHTHLYLTATKQYFQHRQREEKYIYLIRFSFIRFSVRMTIVSCKYFMRGETACKNVTLTGSGKPEVRGCNTDTSVKKQTKQSKKDQ